MTRALALFSVCITFGCTPHQRCQIGDLPIDIMGTKDMCAEIERTGDAECYNAHPDDHNAWKSCLAAREAHLDEVIDGLSRRRMANIDRYCRRFRRGEYHTCKIYEEDKARRELADEERAEDPQPALTPAAHQP